MVFKTVYTYCIRIFVVALLELHLLRYVLQPKYSNNIPPLTSFGVDFTQKFGFGVPRKNWLRPWRKYPPFLPIIIKWINFKKIFSPFEIFYLIFFYIQKCTLAELHMRISIILRTHIKL